MAELSTKINAATPATTLSGMKLLGIDGSGYKQYPASLFQASDADLAAIAALSTTSFGRGLLTLADAAALAALHEHPFSQITDTPNTLAGYGITDGLTPEAASALIVGDAPTALNTLEKLAGSLGNDAAFAASVSAALTLKANAANAALTGTPTAPTAAPGTNNTQIATTAYAEAAAAAAIGDVADDLAAHAALTNNPHGVTKSQVGLANVDNTSDANKPVSSATQAALDAKAPLASPTLTGAPRAPTPLFTDASTRIATTASLADALYDARAIAKVTLPLDAVPGALAAWGLVPLKNSAIGANGFKLRKTSDNTTSDFAFTTRATPRDAVETWKGAETTYNARKACFDTVYDQVGTNHLTQATNNNQPAWLELPDSRIVAAMNGDNLAREGFFSIPDASWNSRNLTVFHVQLPNERTWSGSSSELFINQLNFGWAVTGGYAGISGAESPTNRAIARQWYGGSYTDTPLRQSNAGAQILAVRYNSSNTTLTLHDGTRVTTTVQPNGTLTAGAIGRLAGFALYSQRANWMATLIYPALTDDEVSAVMAALRARFDLGRWTHNIVFDGDSITAGHNESEGFFDVRYTSWPWTLRQNMANNRLKFTNVAISSQTLVTLETAAAQKVDGQISSADFGTNNVLVLFAGTNDINAGADGATAISRLTTYFNNRRTAGWNKIVLCTAIPRENFNSTQNTHRATFNAFIIANTLGADAVVDLAGLSWSFGTHYQGSTPNRIHPNAAGRTLIANAVQTALSALL